MNTLTHLFDWLLAASLRASLLVFAVLLIQAALRRHLSARMRYALWLPVLAVLLIPVLPQSRWSIEYAFQSPPQPVQITQTVSAPTMAEPVPVAFAAPTTTSEPIDWQRILLITWLCGSAGLLVFGSISFMLTLRRFKQARHPASEALLTTLEQIAAEIRLRHIPRVLIASSIRSPAVTGLMRPTLLLPAQFDHEFTPAEARLILKHELMHLKRGDLPLNALMCLLIALHWFNPLLWIAFFKIRADREAACDAQVLHDAPNDRRIAYGHALLKVETAFCPRGLSLGFVGIFQRGSALRSRIQSIAVHRAPHPVMKAIIALCIVLMTFLGITRAANDDTEAPKIYITTKFIEITFRTDQNAIANKALEELLADVPMLSNDSKLLKALLDDAQFQTLIRSLSQTKGVDLMAAPAVTTRSGQQATIEVAREFSSPETKPPLQKVGVFMSVLPTLTDKGILDLVLKPKVVEFDGFVKDLKGQDRPVFSELKADTRAHMTPGQTALIDLGYRVDKQEVLEENELGIVASRRIDHFMRRTLVLVTAQLIRDLPSTPQPLKNIDSQPAKSSAEPQKSDSSYILNKLEKIVIPQIQFQGATVEECLEFLRVKSRSNDTLTADPAKRGVSILYRPGETPSTAAITMDLKDVPLGEALRYVVNLAKLKMSIQPYAVIVGENVSAIDSDIPEPKSAAEIPSPKITFPSLELRDANLTECIDYIRTKARELDPDKKGVNIIVKPGGDETVRFSMSFKDLPVFEVLRYAAELSNHKLTTDARSYYLTPVSVETSAGTGQAQSSADKTSSDTTEAKATELRKASPQSYDFKKAMLGDVLRFLATDAQINFISLPEDDPISQKLITFNIRSSPFEVLETICRANGLSLRLDQNRWFIRADPEVMKKSYSLPQTQANVETILKDINSLLAGDETKPTMKASKTSVTFKKDENTFQVTATQLQHSWVSAYFQGLSSSAKPTTIK
jgi:beta-lactamase regulating signal transducer with metallopeptidase domain